MKTKQMAFVTALALILASNSLWAYSVPTIASLIAADRAKLATVTNNIGQTKSSLNSVTTALAATKTATHTELLNVRHTNRIIAELKAKIIANQGNPAIVKGYNIQLRAAQKSLVSINNVLKPLIVEKNTQLTNLQTFTNQLISQQQAWSSTFQELKYLVAEAKRCGKNSASGC